MIHGLKFPVRLTGALLAGLLLVVACGGSGEPGSAGGGDEDDDGRVIIVNSAFQPQTIHPDSTGAVTWLWNTGGANHNVTFEDGATGSGTKNTGTFSRTFASPGTYRYICTIHSNAFGTGMHGSVVVP